MNGSKSRKKERKSNMGFDKETIKWFEKHPSEQSTVEKCPYCGLFFKPSLGHNCSRRGRKHGIEAERREENAQKN